METLLIVVGIWLILIGIYGAMPLLRRSSRPEVPRIARTPVLEAIQRQVEGRDEPLLPPAPPPEPPGFEEAPSEVEAPSYSVSVRPDPRFEAPTRPQSVAPEPLPNDPYAEVSLLRAQIEHLRSELNALSNNQQRAERSRTRRYRTGPYTDLPLTLRRQVHEVRSVRRPVRG